MPYAKITRSADTVTGWTTRDYSRIQFIKTLGCSNVVVFLGTNDLTSISAASLELLVVQLATQIKEIPTVRALFWATTLPRTSSTDGFITTGNQTDLLSGKGVTFNTWLRTIPAPLDGIIETAYPVESSQNSGLWASDGSTINLNTADGVHPTKHGHATIAASVAASFGAQAK